MQKEYSAGGVVVGGNGEVLVVSQGGDSWSLPKGHIDSGETARQAAEREIREESGVSRLTFIKPLGAYERYKIGPGGQGEDTSRLKHIEMFLYATDESMLHPEDPANPEARWVAPAEVSSLLTHPKDQAFFTSVLPDVQTYLTDRGASA
jgi:ADP-ribose pyrophosphatase YjhB (NUDIX family)